MRKPFDQDFITRAIVGKPKMYRLGVLSRPLGGPMLADGEGAVRANRVQRLRTALEAGWAQPGWRWGAAGATALVLLAVGAAITLQRDREPELPRVAAAPAPVAAAPATSSPTLPLAPAGTSAGEVPAPTSAIGISTGTFVSPPALHTKEQSSPPSSRPAPQTVKEQEKAPAAVVLDASAKPQATATPPAKPAPAPAAAAPPRIATPTREVAAGGAESKPADAAPRVNLVDIDKGGNFALITNPQTRLPEKVSVGQKIFTGETVKKIDATAGKVYLDNRAISMQ